MSLVHGIPAGRTLTGASTIYYNPGLLHCAQLDRSQAHPHRCGPHAALLAMAAFVSMAGCLPPGGSYLCTLRSAASQRCNHQI